MHPVLHRQPSPLRSAMTPGSLCEAQYFYIRGFVQTCRDSAGHFSEWLHTRWNLKLTIPRARGGTSMIDPFVCHSVTISSQKRAKTAYLLRHNPSAKQPWLRIGPTYKKPWQTWMYLLSSGSQQVHRYQRRIVYPILLPLPRRRMHCFPTDVPIFQGTCIHINANSDYVLVRRGRRLLSRSVAMDWENPDDASTQVVFTHHPTLFG